MENQGLILISLQAISTICFFLGVFVINGFKGALDKMQTSVVDLNINITKLIEKDMSKDRRLQDHSTTIRKLDRDVAHLKIEQHDNFNGVSSKVELVCLDVSHLKKRLDKLDSITNG